MSEWGHGREFSFLFRKLFIVVQEHNAEICSIYKKKIQTHFLQVLIFSLIFSVFTRRDFLNCAIITKGICGQRRQ
jgi:hypothetical protein